MTLVCVRTQSLTRATGATVEMHEGDDMVYRACTGSLATSLGLRLQAATSLSGLCVRTGEVLYCEDSETDARVNREACRKVGARSMICVPLSHQQKNVGVLKMVSTEANAFTEREVNLLRLIAGLLSSSIAQTTSRQSLEASELKFRTLIATAGDGIMVSENGVAIEANPAFCQLFGYEHHEVIGRSVLDFVIPELAGRTEEYVRNGYDVPYETQCKRKDGSAFFAEANGRTVELDGRRVRVTTLRDISERKLFDETLRASEHRARQADQAKSNFLANMSHEIRTPLNGIIGMTYLLRDSKLDETQAEFVDTILTSSDSLLAIVNDVLDLSKIEAQKLSLEVIPFDFQKMIDDVGRTIGHTALKKGIGFTANHAAELNTRLKGDPTRMRQVLTNLLNNAVKFTSRGSVSVTTKFLKTTGNRVSFRVEVQDTGIGINPEALDSMFKPFSQADASTTRKFGGTGLGLSICKSLVEAMGGTIGVDSIEGSGSTFWFEMTMDVDATLEDKSASRS